jgi:hypothetical protein
MKLLPKETILLPENMPAGEIRVCECGNLIFPTGRRGRPAIVCETCRDEIKAVRDANRVTRCINCKHFLPKPKGQGRPPKLCISCRSDLVEFHSTVTEGKRASAIERGFCEAACMYALGDECDCYCDGHFHQAGLATHTH